MNANNQGVEAGLFHPDFGNEVVHGRIFIDRQGVRFTAEGISESIPAERVEVSLEKNGDRVYFADADRPEIHIFTTDLSILKHPSTRACESVRSQLENLLGQKELRRRLKLTAYFLVTCVLLVLAGSWMFGVAVRSLAKHVPPEWEKKFGDQAMDDVRRKFHVEDDTNRTAQLAELAQPLIQVLPPDQRDIKFYIVDYDLPNAFALPGGHVCVTTALLDLVDRPEQLLGVMAHELAHVTQKHHARKIISAAGPVAVFGVFLHSRSWLMNVLTLSSGLMVVQGYSKEFETEADEVGWDYMVAANIDPHGMIEMFEKFKSWQNGKTIIGLPEVLEGHPGLDTRIADLERKEKKLSNTNFPALPPFILKPERRK